MSAASASPTASLRPRLCVEVDRVYGGRVIAESEEEYTSRHAAIMSPGLVDPGQPLSLAGAPALEPGGQIGRYRIVHGTAAHMSFPQGHPEERQVLGSVSAVNPTKQLPSMQEGGMIMCYPGANIDRSTSGLRRSIREHCPMFVHAVLPGQMTQQASLPHSQHQQSHFLQGSRDVVEAVECPNVPLRSRPFAPSIQGVHSLPTRDPRISHHSSRLQDGSALHHRRVQRELNLIKAPENSLAPAEVVYTAQQQQQHLLSHRETPGGSNGFMAMQSSGLSKRTPLAVDSVRPLSTSAIQPLSFRSVEHSIVQSDSLQPLHSVLGSGKLGESGRSCRHGESDRNIEGSAECPLAMPAPRPCHSYSESGCVSPQNVLVGNAKVLSGTPGSVPAHLLDHHSIGFPQAVPSKQLQKGAMTAESSAGLSHMKLSDSHQVPVQPASAPVDYSRSTARLHSGQAEEVVFDTSSPQNAWIPISCNGQLKDEKPWTPSDTGREGEQFPSTENMTAGSENEDDNKGRLLDLDHVLCDNDEILRPFGDTVGTDDIFGEGFALDGSLPVSGAFATAIVNGAEGRDCGPNGAPGIKSHLEVDVPTSLQEACKGFSTCDFPHITCKFKENNSQWEKTHLDTNTRGPSNHMSHNDHNLWDSEEEDASPTTSLGLNLADLQHIPDMHVRSSIGDGHEEILVDREEHVLAEQDGSSEVSGGAVSEDLETIDDDGLDMELVNGEVALKSPKAFHGSHSAQVRPQRSDGAQPNRPKILRASQGSRQRSSKNKRPRNASNRTNVKKKLPFEINEFFASAGLGFDNDEPCYFPKTPPRFPRKMVVKREDVLQLAISMTGKPAATAEEIQEICRWWMHQSEAEAGAASRANVLRNWHGLKIAAAFSEGSKGLTAIQRCMENSERFVVCGLGPAGQEFWGVQHVGKGHDDAEERRSDSDEKTMYWTSEPDEWRAREEGACASVGKAMQQKSLLYQKITQNEYERRQKLMQLQNNLEPKGCESTAINSMFPMHKGPKQPSAFSGGEDHQAHSWLLPEDTQSLNHSSSCKRRRTTRKYTSNPSDDQAHGESSSLFKHKTRSLSDVYARGPKNLTGNDSSVTLVDQELDSNTCLERVNNEDGPGVMELTLHAARNENCNGFDDWMCQGQSTCPVGVDFVQ